MHLQVSSRVHLSPISSPRISSRKRWVSISNSSRDTISCSNMVFSSIARLYLLSKSRRDDTATLLCSAQTTALHTWILTSRSAPAHHFPFPNLSGQRASCPSLTEGCPSLATHISFCWSHLRDSAHLHSASRGRMHFLKGYMFVLRFSFHTPTAGKEAAYLPILLFSF